MRGPELGRHHRAELQNQKDCQVKRVVLNQGQFCPPGDSGQSMSTSISGFPNSQVGSGVGI